MANQKRVSIRYSFAITGNRDPGTNRTVVASLGIHGTSSGPIGRIVPIHVLRVGRVGRGCS